ncbi:RluA family pseudouridine synthase [Eubacteriales bacterium KG127]
MKAMKVIEIKADDAGRRLDRFLKKYLPKASLSMIYKQIRKNIKINGKRGKFDALLQEGDTIALYLSDQEVEKLREKIKPINVKRNFSVVYEDEYVLIVNKPSGLLTHGDEKEKKNHLANQVLTYLIEKNDFNPSLSQSFTPAPANRLDRNTSGLVIFGKTGKVLRSLNKAFRERNVEKKYLAVCQGALRKEIELKGYMTKQDINSVISVKVHDKWSDESKDVHTKIKPVTVGEYKREKYTLVQVELLTGRTHQIRAHLSSVGHPILGDLKYGGKLIKEFGVRNQMLCAYKLKFLPVTCTKKQDNNVEYLANREFITEPDEQMIKVIEKIFKRSLGDLING